MMAQGEKKDDGKERISFRVPKDLVKRVKIHEIADEVPRDEIGEKALEAYLRSLSAGPSNSVSG